MGVFPLNWSGGFDAGFDVGFDAGVGEVLAGGFAGAEGFGKRMRVSSTEAGIGAPDWEDVWEDCHSSVAPMRAGVARRCSTGGGAAPVAVSACEESPAEWPAELNISMW